MTRQQKAPARQWILSIVCYKEILSERGSLDIDKAIAFLKAPDIPGVSVVVDPDEDVAGASPCTPHSEKSDVPVAPDADNADWSREEAEQPLRSPDGGAEEAGQEAAKERARGKEPGGGCSRKNCSV